MNGEIKVWTCRICGEQSVAHNEIEAHCRGASPETRHKGKPMVLKTYVDRDEVNRHAIAWENNGEDCRMFTDGEKFVIGIEHHGDSRFIELGSGRDFLTALECVKVGGG